MVIHGWNNVWNQESLKEKANIYEILEVNAKKYI